MKVPVSRMLLGGLLLFSIFAAVWVGDETDEGEAPHRPAKRGGTSVPLALARPEGEAPATAELRPLPAPDETVAEDVETASSIDPFRSKSWYVAPPAPPPPKPTAPPLPFRFLGRMVDGGEKQVFLAQQNRHLIVRVGDVINGTYSVEQIGDDGITFIYLPLKESQWLPMNGQP